jgi:hypothetical protein
MYALFRRALPFFLSAQITLLGITFDGHGAQHPPAPPSPAKTAPSSQPGALRDLLQKSYEEFSLAPTRTFSTAEIEALRKNLGNGKELCVSRFKEHAKAILEAN